MGRDDNMPQKSPYFLGNLRHPGVFRNQQKGICIVNTVRLHLKLIDPLFQQEFNLIWFKCHVKSHVILLENKTTFGRLRMNCLTKILRRWNWSDFSHVKYPIKVLERMEMLQKNEVQTVIPAEMCRITPKLKQKLVKRHQIKTIGKVLNAT